jgi:hypothetical protein
MVFSGHKLLIACRIAVNLYQCHCHYHKRDDYHPGGKRDNAEKRRIYQEIKYKTDYYQLKDNKTEYQGCFRVNKDMFPGYFPADKGVQPDNNPDCEIQDVTGGNQFFHLLLSIKRQDIAP